MKLLLIVHIFYKSFILTINTSVGGFELDIKISIFVIIQIHLLLCYELYNEPGVINLDRFQIFD